MIANCPFMELINVLRLLEVIRKRLLRYFSTGIKRCESRVCAHCGRFFDSFKRFVWIFLSFSLLLLDRVCVCVEIQIWFLIIFFSCYLCAHIFLPHSSEPSSWLILMDWARTTAPHKNRQRDGNDDLPHENRIKHSKDTHSLRHRFLLLLGISADLPCTIGIVNVNGHEYYFAQMMHKKNAVHMWCTYLVKE